MERNSHHPTIWEIYRGPPVVFVATHAGEPNTTEIIEDHEPSLLNIIESRGYEGHVVTPKVGGTDFIFPVDKSLMYQVMHLSIKKSTLLRDASL